MNLWRILQIEPTTDLRAIKKAYAKRSKEVHPEEKPEEFSQLYEAYQSALAYAKMAETQDQEDRKQEETLPLSSPVFAQDDQTEISEKDDSEVLTYFTKQQELLQAKLEEFQKQWNIILKANDRSPALEHWVTYLGSEDFQEMRWNPQVLELLEQNMERLIYAPSSKLALWDAYGFQVENRLDYHGDVLRLFEELLPFYEKKTWMDQKAQERIERNKAEERQADLKKTFFRFALLLFCVAVPLFVYLHLTAERRFLSTEMRIKYSTDSFTKPEKMDPQENVNTVYTFYSRNHPDLKIEAEVSRNFQSEYVLKENYGLKLLQYYGEPYGIEFGSMEGYVLYYSDIEDVDRVCDSLFKLLEEEGGGELSYLDSVGICWKHAQYPKDLVGGGIQSRPPAQFYPVEELNDKETLKQSVKEAYVDYMYNYEAWNLTPEQQAAYGPAYTAKGREDRVENGGNPWSSDSKVKGIEKEFDLYIPIYEKTFYKRGTDMPNAPQAASDRIWTEIYITVGNAYQLLKASKTAVSVKEDGSGFVAEKDGMSSSFGEEAEVELDVVKELMMEEPEEMMELPSWFWDVLP